MRHEYRSNAVSDGTGRSVHFHIGDGYGIGGQAGQYRSEADIIASATRSDGKGGYGDGNGADAISDQEPHKCVLLLGMAL